MELQEDVENPEEIKVEIQNTLQNINHVTEKIKHELSMINELVKEHGELPTTVESAYKALLEEVRQKGISPEDIATKKEEYMSLLPASQGASITSSMITEKLCEFLHE